jgi:uncharacterized membrane protein
MRIENGNNLTNNTERQLALVGGSLFMLMAVRERSWPGLILGALGTTLLVRGLTGESLLNKMGINTADADWLPQALQPSGLAVTESLTVNCTPGEAYQYWRNLENLPHFMTHLESVKVEANGRSHWVVKAPAGITLTWDAEITDDRPNEMIQWQTLPSAAVQHTGRVHFKPAPAGRGTEVMAHFHYEPPGGIVGEAFAYLANNFTEQFIREEIRRFKAVLEAGEVPTIEGQPAARKE